MGASCGWVLIPSRSSPNSAAKLSLPDLVIKKGTLSSSSPKSNEAAEEKRNKGAKHPTPCQLPTLGRKYTYAIVQTQRTKVDFLLLAQNSPCSG